VVLPVVLVGTGAPAWAGPAAPTAPAPPGSAPGDWWFAKLKIAEAHRLSTGAGITIGLIDGPTDPTVPALVGQRLVPVRSFCGPDGDLTSQNPHAAHATQIARLLIGSGRDGRAPGIVPDATVRSYVVDAGLTETTSCSSGGVDKPRLTLENIGAGIDAAVADRVNVISISLGFLEGDENRAALRHARDAGIPVVVAAGNRRSDGRPDGLYPANDESVIAVTAADEQAKAWSGNVTSAYTRVAAPGVALAAGTRREDYTWDDAGLATGTSYAAPLAAGALALVMARYPGATRNQLIRHLVTHTSASQLYQSRDLGFGIISLGRLLGDDPRRQPDDDPFAAHGVAGVDINVLASALPVAGGAVPAPRSAPVAEQRDSANSGSLLPIAGGGIVLAGAAGGGALLVRRRRRPKEA
jgi:subtilisin family serine protease